MTNSSGTDTGVAVIARQEADARRALIDRGLDGLPVVARFGDGPLCQPAFDFFRTSTRLARGTLGELQEPLGPLLSCRLGGVDIGRALLVRMAYGAMSVEAPLLSMAVAGGATDVVLVNGSFSAAPVSALTGVPVRLLATAGISAAAIDALKSLRRPWWRRSRHPAEGGLLAIVGGNSEWPAVLAAIAALPSGQGVVLLGKGDRPPPPEVMASLVGRPHVVAPLAAAVTGLVAAGPVRQARALLKASFPPGRGGVRDGVDAALAGVGVHALGTVRWALAMAGLVERYRPRLVLGAFEKTIHGPVLSDLRQIHGFAVINLQHGLIARSDILDTMSFDAFLTWGEMFSRACAEDGYGPADSLVVVGNPAWDLPQAARPGRKAVGVLPQVPGKGYIGVAMLRRFYAALAGYASARPDVGLVVKPHPADSTDPLGHCPALAALQQDGRVEILPAGGEAVRQFAGRVDVTVTIYSTAALDCLAAGIPGIAFDPGRVLDHMEAQVETLLPRAESEVQLSALLDSYLYGPDRGATRMPPGQDVFPRFAQPYADRIGAVVKGLLRR